MIFSKTKISGVYVIEPELKKDERGWFARIFCEEEFEKASMPFRVRQASKSLTKQKGALRGMHFQIAPKEEDKVVRCLKGKIFDVVLDLRPNSPTFKQWISEELSEENQKMLHIPKGCAHGFVTLTENCEVEYLISEFYSPEHSSGVRWNDPAFKIAWPVPNPTLSEKDKNWPLMK